MKSSNSTIHVHRWVALTKRLLDILVSLAGLVLALPVLSVIAVVICLDSKGPALFRQQRIGRAWPDRVEVFWMYKFRSMRVNAEAQSGAVWATKNDPRTTRVGDFLRKTRLDEIPQLFNVLRGDMSLIGPRPERPELYGKLEKAIPFFYERTYGLRPGITGLAQVYQGYDESIEDVRNKVSYDHAYALCLSHPVAWLSRELEIIWRTVVVMACGRGQ